MINKYVLLVLSETRRKSMAKSTHRPVNTINQEYFRKAAELGDLQFRLEIGIPRSMEKVKHELLTLNKEANEAQAYETKKEQEKALEAALKAKAKEEIPQGVQP
jgi:hypothetical protein